MSDKTHRIIEAVAASVDIPETAYDKAEARYKDLGKWFKRPEAACYGFDPHTYAIGAQIAFPRWQVIAFAGDGGFTMMLRTRSVREIQVAD